MCPYIFQNGMYCRDIAEGNAYEYLWNGLKLNIRMFIKLNAH